MLEQFEDRLVPTTLSIPTDLTAVPGGTVVVPVNIDNPNPPGSGGLNAATLAIDYDTRVFAAVSADVQLGTVTSGWSLNANTNAKTGQIGITLTSNTPASSTLGGSLVLINFHVNPNGIAGPTAINLAAALAERKIHTLVVDLDPQANATSALGVEKFEGKSL